MSRTAFFTRKGDWIVSITYVYLPGNTSILLSTLPKIRMDTKRISIIDDIADIRNSVSKFISFHQEFEVKEGFDSIESFLHHLSIEPDYKVDILLLDVGLPGMSGIEGISHIIRDIPDIDIIMLTTYEEEEVILKALCSGACSYISKKASLKQIVEAIRIVAKGGSYMSPSIAREIVNHLLGGTKPMAQNSLSERQNQILKGLSEGKSYKHISEELFVSVETVRSHIKKLYRHLQVNNKAEAIAMYLQGKIK